MSDIRQPTNVRLNRLPGTERQAETERTEQLNNTTGSNQARVASTTAATNLHPTRVIQDTSETRGSADRPNVTVTGRGIDSPTSAPTSPIARVANLQSAQDPSAGARSFIENLHALNFSEGNDSDAMTASFLKLETTNMSTNQSIEGYLNQAKHYLREAAFKIERALSKQNPDALLAQADQLEQQAAEMVRGALEAQGMSGGEIDEMLTALETGSTNSNVDQNTMEIWDSIYDSASRAISDAAQASLEEKEALEAGDQARAAAARERADAAEARARTMLESAGIDVSKADAEELGKLALEMKEAGDDSNVITKFLELHPEKAEKLLPPEKYAEVKDKGGEAIVAAIKEHQASQIDPLSVQSLGLAANAADQQALTEIMEKFPEAAAIQGELGSAIDMLIQAYELRMRAYQMKEALLDAQNAIHEGKTDDGQFGVARRNAVAQNDIMRSFARLTGGSRPDMQAREDANMEARRARPQVVQFMRDMIDHDARTLQVRRTTQVRT